MALKETTRVPRARSESMARFCKKKDVLWQIGRERSLHTTRIGFRENEMFTTNDGNPDTWTLVDSVYVAGFVSSEYIHDARAVITIIYFFFKIDSKRKT